MGEDRRTARDAADDRVSLGAALPLRGRVYYVRKGERFKIGYTEWLRARMLKLRPDELLAVEPGGRDLETRRHHMFADERITPRGEWFRPSERLILHIYACRDAHPVPDLDAMLRRRHADGRDKWVQW